MIYDGWSIVNPRIHMKPKIFVLPQCHQKNRVLLTFAEGDVRGLLRIKPACSYTSHSKPRRRNANSKNCHGTIFVFWSERKGVTHSHLKMSSRWRHDRVQRGRGPGLEISEPGNPKKWFCLAHHFDSDIENLRTTCSKFCSTWRLDPLSVHPTSLHHSKLSKLSWSTFVRVRLQRFHRVRRSNEKHHRCVGNGSSQQMKMDKTHMTEVSAASEVVDSALRVTVLFIEKDFFSARRSGIVQYDTHLALLKLN